MKNLLSILMLLGLSLPSLSQKKQRDCIQLWDKDGTSVQHTRDAWYFTRIRLVNDTCWRFQNYEMIGPLVSSREFKDYEGKIPHGRSSFMRPDGTLDSTGYFVNGKPHGEWLYFNNAGNLVEKKEYSSGQVLRNLNPAEETNDSTGYIHFVEAQFPGSTNAWTMYLIRNLRYPPNAFSGKIQGHVKVHFRIDAEGKVRDEVLLKSAEFTLDDEALRLIRESPQWIAASRNGSKVESYAQQQIQFRTDPSTSVR